jgi:hypothetical protein
VQQLDIVESLRAFEKHYGTKDGLPYLPIFGDAANEFERLQSELVRNADELRSVRKRESALRSLIDRKECLLDTMVGMIKTLEADRDEARREVCRRENNPFDYASRRGWDCFEKEER